ncbi:MAG: hypothetical protein JRJ77_15020 [Deltaproteobacteria bacterium]|nr:hypothetical protein [Deltaproteobacteria bacterium]
MATAKSGFKTSIATFHYSGQRNVKVQGMGIFFLVMPLAQTWYDGLWL